LPELTGIGATPAARASLASVLKRVTPAISPINFAAVSGPNPGSPSSCGATSATRSEISASSASTATVSSRRRRSSSRAILTRAVCSARARRRPIAVDHFFETRPLPGSLSSGPEVVQVPEQVVVDRDAAANQPLPVVDQQPDIKLGARQLRRGQRVRAFAQRRASDRQRVDRIGLAAAARGAPRVGHQLCRDADHALTAD